MQMPRMFNDSVSHRPRIDAIREKVIQSNDGAGLSIWDAQFLDSIYNYESVSPKQWVILTKIQKKVIGE